MRAIVDTKEFAQALTKVTKVIKRTASPSLEGVLVQITEGRCTLTATDFTTWLTTTIPVEGDNLSFVFQQPKDTAKACKCFEGKLVLETEEKTQGRNRWIQLTMTCGPRAAQVTAFVPEDYPPTPEVEALYTYTVNAARLWARTAHVKYALYKPDPGTRAQGTHVQFSGNHVYALDGSRMAWDTDDSLYVHQPFMVLPEALGYLKFFSDQEITVHMGKNYLQMADETTIIQTRIEGPFVFDLDGAVPKEFREEFCISPKEFLGELEYLKRLLRSTDKARIYFSDGKLLLTAASGNYSTQVQVDGENTIGFGFELDYMADALRQFQEEPYVKMKVNSSVAPIVLEAEDRSDFAMVLPVRVKQTAAA